MVELILTKGKCGDSVLEDQSSAGEEAGPTDACPRHGIVRFCHAERFLPHLKDHPALTQQLWSLGRRDWQLGEQDPGGRHQGRQASIDRLFLEYVFGGSIIQEQQEHKPRRGCRTGG